MLVVTTENVPGHTVKAVLGQVFGFVAALMGGNVAVMIRFDSGEITQSMNEVVAYGTVAYGTVAYGTVAYGTAVILDPAPE